jgi:hypothetical protein
MTQDYSLPYATHCNSGLTHQDVVAWMKKKSIGDIPEKGACENLLREMFIIYNFIHYRLDRPTLPDDYWLEHMNILRERLEQGLAEDRIPDNWFEDLFSNMTGSAKYESIRKPPLFEEGKEKIGEVLDRLKRIEFQSRSLSPRERNQYVKDELAKVRDWALRNAWETTSIVGFQNI